MDRAEFEHTWIASLLENAEDTVDLFYKRKPESERRACAAFLRCLQIEFDPAQITSTNPGSEPPDVLFDGAAFEITQVLDSGRRMHAEWKSRVEKYRSARSLTEILAPYKSPATLTRAGLMSEAVVAGDAKRKKYERRQKINLNALDLLIYFNRNVLLDVDSPDPDPTNLAAQGWRSVSVLVPNFFGCVLCTTRDAPEVLRAAVGKLCAPRRGEGLFDL